MRVAPEIVMPEGYYAYWRSTGLDATEFAGAEVRGINSWPPLTYMQFLGDNYIGISRDNNTRLNLGLAHPIRFNGSWGITNGMFFGSLFCTSHVSLTSGGGAR